LAKSSSIPRIERWMTGLAGIQVRFYVPIIIASLALTALLAVGLSNVRIQSDFTKILPENLPEIVYQNKITDTFGGSDTIFVLVRLDRECASCTGLDDIRDPRVIRMMADLEQSLRGETGVTSVASPASFFQGASNVPATLDGVKLILSRIPGSASGFNRDFSATSIIISASIGGDQQKISKFVDAIRNDIANIEKPPGIVMTVTGTPELNADIFRLLEEDAVNVTLIAGIVILAMMLLLLRSPLRVFQTYTPVLFSLVWTMGLMGWANIQLSVATAAIGAFIIGLGIEYGIFFVKRFEEGLKAGKGIEDSMTVAVAGIGSAITSSGATTIVGFLALMLTILPIIQVLGLTLALSILFSLVAALIINPALMIAEEKLIRRRKERRTHGNP
jgi:hydrophobe/amphiphile efflux-3 (HAE3) family protein